MESPKQNLAMAYALKRRGMKMAKGGEVHDKPMTIHEAPMDPEETEMCAHGGPTMCAEGCYAEGGDVGGDLDSEMPMADESLENEEGDPVSLLDSEEDEQKRMKMAKGGMILHKILGGISKAHKG